MPATVPFHAMTAETTINDVLAACPEATAVLSDHELDTCCGGGLSLADACADAGVPVDEVLRELARVWDAA